MFFIQHFSSATPQNQLYRRMLGWNPELLRLWYCQSDALITRLDLIHDPRYILLQYERGIHRRKVSLILSYTVIYNHFVDPDPCLNGEKLYTGTVLIEKFKFFFISF
jgi:hypothetical protein